MEEVTSTSLALAQPAVITGIEVMQAVKAEWERMADEMESMAPTEKNKSTIKAQRAEARKRRDELWGEVKAVIELASQPANALKTAFADCIDAPFKRLDASGKDKVSAIEEVQKAGTLERCKAYFAELCTVYSIDFLTWDDFVKLSKFKVSMTEAKKQSPTGHFEQISLFLACVAEDLKAISDGENTGEVIAEYKANGLNLSKALSTVKARAEAVEVERKRLEERREAEQRKAEAVKRVEEAVAVPVPAVVETPEEKLLTVTFTATATREKLIALREWMKVEGIMYK